MAHPELVVVADDFTGAADACGALARAGLRPRLFLSLPEHDADTGVAALDMDSRERPAEEAAARAVGAGEWCRRQGARHVFHKVDSTLRGHPGVEMDALLETLGRSLALFAPAFPAMGRTVQDGQVFIETPGSTGGRRAPLPETEYWPRGRPPCAMVDLLRAQSGRRVRVLRAEQVDCGEEGILGALAAACRLGYGVVAPDATMQRDLAEVARAAARLEPPCLWCGSAGLAAELPYAVRLAAQPAADTPLARQPTGGTGLLVVAGSAASATRRQVDALEEVPGVHIVGLGAPAGVAVVARRTLQGGGVVLLQPVDASAAPSSAEREEVARRLAETARSLLDVTPLPALLIAGGATARAVLETAGVGALTVVGEWEPGVPLLRAEDGGLRGGVVATKAGGFGDPQCLARFVASWRAGV